MFGIGMPELILILAVALIVIGPKKLPDLAKSLGKAMGEFKKATNDIKDSMQLDSDIQEVKTSFKDLEQELKKPLETTASQDQVPAPGQETISAGEADSDTELSEADLEAAASNASPPDTDSGETDGETSPPTTDDPRAPNA